MKTNEPFCHFEINLTVEEIAAAVSIWCASGRPFPQTDEDVATVVGTFIATAFRSSLVAAQKFPGYRNLREPVQALMTQLADQAEPIDLKGRMN